MTAGISCWWGRTRPRARNRPTLRQRGYHITLIARSTDGLDKLVDSLADTGAKIDTVTADASDPDALGDRITALYSGQDAPGVIVYNAVMGAPDQLLTASVAHLQAAYAVDVIGAIVVAQRAAPAMRAAGSGTIIVTGGGFADYPIPALATVSLGKAALRSAATMLGADLDGSWHPSCHADDHGTDRCGHCI